MPAMSSTQCSLCLKTIMKHEKFTQCVTCHDLFHSVPHCLNSQETVNNSDSVFKCQKCHLLLFPNLTHNETKTGDVFSKSDMDRLNQLKINPFTLNKKVALSENNVNLDMLNNLDTVNCNYYTPAKFQEQSINENSENFFSIFHLNIRSISNKFDMFKQLTSTLNKKFKVIGITETWLNDDNANNFGLEGYKYIGVNRSNKKGGGVGIYMTEKFNYKLRNDLSTNVDDVIESTFIEIIASTGKNIIVGVIYRPPNNKFDTFEIAMNGILNTIDKENKICYLIGDFNIDLLKSESCDYSNRFIEQLFTSSFYPLITKPTRVTAHTSTLIDNIFTNNIQQVDKSINGIIFSDISDHLPIVHMCSTNTTYNTNNDKISGSYYRRMINNNNISLFTESLKELTWDSVTIESDPIQCFKTFSEIFSENYESNFPLKKYQIKKLLTKSKVLG